MLETLSSTLIITSGGGAGTQSSEESADSSEDDLYQGGNGFNSGERQSDQTRVSQHGQTVKSPITTLLGHNGVVISCGKLLKDFDISIIGVFLIKTQTSSYIFNFFF